MIPVNQENLARSAAPVADVAAATSEGERHEETADERHEAVPVELKGDPEMAPVFLRHLFPIFTHVFQGAMVQSVRCVLLCDSVELDHFCLHTCRVVPDLFFSNPAGFAGFGMTNPAGAGF